MLNQPRPRASASVDPSDRAARHLHNGIARVFDLRIGNFVAADVRLAVPAQSLHGISPVGMRTTVIPARLRGSRNVLVCVVLKSQRRLCTRVPRWAFAHVGNMWQLKSSRALLDPSGAAGSGRRRGETAGFSRRRSSTLSPMNSSGGRAFANSISMPRRAANRDIESSHPAWKADAAKAPQRLHALAAAVTSEKRMDAVLHPALRSGGGCRPS